MGGATITTTTAEAVTKANVTDLNNFTTAKVTVTSVQDSRSNVSDIAAINNAEVDMSAAAVTITDAVTLAQANTDVGNLNSLTTGKVTLNSVEDTYDNIQSIKLISDDDVDMGAAAVKVTSVVDKTKVDDLRTDTTGNITVDSISDNKTNLGLVNDFADVSLAAANISVTDVVTLAQANTDVGLSLIHI